MGKEEKSTEIDNNPQKKAVIEAYIKSFGNISSACRAAGINRQTYYNWLNKDKDFKTAIENSGADEYFLDFLDSKLVDRINNNSDACLIFALKTKGKKRGYIEKQELDVNSKSETTVNIPIISWIDDKNKQ